MSENKITISPKGVIFKSLGGYKKELETGKSMELCTKITQELSRFMQQHKLRIEWIRVGNKDQLIFTEQPDAH